MKRAFLFLSIHCKIRMVKKMKLEIAGESYPIIIEKKKTTKNLYIRVKDDLAVHITCHTFTSDRQIEEIIRKNQKVLWI